MDFRDNYAKYGSQWYMYLSSFISKSSKVEESLPFPCLNMGRDARKLVFGVFDKASFNPDS